MSINASNIVIITSEFPPQPGGIGNHAYNLALHLSHSGLKVQVIADQRSKSGKEELDFDASLPFSVERIKLYNPRFFMYFKRIILTLKYVKHTSCCIATGKFSLWSVAFSSFFYDRKKIAIIHGTEVNYKSAFLRKSIDISLKRFNDIVAVSNYTKDLVSHLNREVQVIPNGITLSEWKKSKEKITLKGNPVLTTVGRVSSRKGQLNVIRHLPELIKQFPEIHYHCVGIPTEAERFLKIAESLSVSSHVTFHGSVGEHNLKQILDASQIFIMLSTESDTGDVEGFGIAILEANAMGVPAIGAKGCGIEDAIDNYNSGILVNNDAAQLRVAIVEILKDIENYKHSSITWAAKHSWTNIIQAYMTLIKD